MKVKEELMKGLTEDQIDKIKACEDPRDLLQLAKDEGFELTHEQLEALSGASCFPTDICSECGAKNDYTKTIQPNSNGYHRYLYKCNKCGNTWFCNN